MERYIPYGIFHLPIWELVSDSTLRCPARRKWDWYTAICDSSCRMDHMPCPSCRGTGRESETSRACSTFHGKGQIPLYAEDPFLRPTEGQNALSDSISRAPSAEIASLRDAVSRHSFSLFGLALIASMHGIAYTSWHSVELAGAITGCLTMEFAVIALATTVARAPRTMQRRTWAHSLKVEMWWG